MKQPKQLDTLFVNNVELDKNIYKVKGFVLEEYELKPYDYEIKHAIIDELINNIGLELTDTEYNLLKKHTTLNKIKVKDIIYVSVETCFNEVEYEDLTDVLKDIDKTTNLGFGADKVFFISTYDYKQGEVL